MQDVQIVSNSILKTRVHSLLALGTTGKGLLLDLSERKAVAERIVRHVDQRVPVIGHTGHITTKFSGSSKKTDQEGERLCQLVMESFRALLFP